MFSDLKNKTMMMLQDILKRNVLCFFLYLFLFDAMHESNAERLGSSNDLLDENNIEIDHIIETTDMEIASQIRIKMDAYKYSIVDKNGDPIFRPKKKERGLFMLLRQSQTFQKIYDFIITSDKALTSNTTEINIDSINISNYDYELSFTTFFSNQSSMSLPILNSSHPSFHPTSFDFNFSSYFSTPSMQPSIESFAQSNQPSLIPSERHSVQPSLQPSERYSNSPTIEESSFPTVEKKELTVGVYYYPWYAKDFHGGQYLREFLVVSEKDCEFFVMHVSDHFLICHFFTMF